MHGKEKISVCPHLLRLLGSIDSVFDEYDGFAQYLFVMVIQLSFSCRLETFINVVNKCSLF